MARKKRAARPKSITGENSSVAFNATPFAVRAVAESGPAPKPFEVSPADMAKLRTAQNGLESLLGLHSRRVRAESASPAFAEGAFGSSNIVGTCIAEKQTRSDVNSASETGTGQMCITVFVKKKSFDRAEAGGAAIPSEIEGVATDVVEVGEIAPQGLRCGIGSSLQPALSGVLYNYYGTMACLCARKLRVDNNLYILSNQHVLAPGRYGNPNTVIFHGSVNNIVGQNVYWTVFSGTNPNLHDAALARTIPSLVDPRHTNFTIKNSPIRSSEYVINMPVKKEGARTGLTYGYLRGWSSNLNVPYPTGQNVSFRNQLWIQGAGGVPFSAPGDSGSLVVGPDNRPLGLHFAGYEGDVNSFSNRIEDVMGAFGIVDFVTSL